MRYKKIIFLIFFIIAIGGMAIAKEGEGIKLNPLITDIEIKGNTVISTEVIAEGIFSKPGDALSETKIKEDMKAIYALGYFADVSATFESYRRGTRVTFRVKENPVINNIVIGGNTVYSTSEIISKMKTKIGEILSYNTLQKDIKNLEERYHRDGYILSRIVDVSTNPDLGRLTIKIVEGSIENIIIEGNNVTQDYVIRRELRLKPGDVLNEKILSKDLRSIFNLGFFSDISPNFEPGSIPSQIILILNVKETRTSSLNFGGGYGEREGWFGFSDLNIDNLLGTGQGLLLRGQFGQELSTYQFRYFHPFVSPEIFGDHTAATFRRWYTVGRDIYVIERSGIYNGWDLSLSRPFFEDYKAALTVGRENVTPTAGSTFESYDQRTISLALSYDTRDIWMNPTKGVYYTLAISQGWKWTTTALTLFSKYSADFNQFYPLAERQVLAFHAGTGIGFGDVPIGELYWMGGANTVRGYAPSEAHIGRRKVLTNLEYRYTFNEVFQGVLFYDWGDAWDTGGPDPNNFLTGKGFGIRLNTPLGPIRLDFGIAGGRSFGEGVTHFSIGQAF